VFEKNEQNTENENVDGTDERPDVHARNIHVPCR